MEEKAMCLLGFLLLDFKASKYGVEEGLKENRGCPLLLVVGYVQIGA
jgi:hypothetical protein